jgi:hypothetical protein
MAKNLEIPSKEEATELSLPVLRVGELTIIRLPDGTCDFFLSGSDRYLVQFLNPEVFGRSIALLNPGHTLITPLNDYPTETYLISEAEVASAMGDPNRVKTGPIIIPPRPGPRRELEKAG